jgi:hypothetical protein
MQSRRGVVRYPNGIRVTTDCQKKPLNHMSQIDSLTSAVLWMTSQNRGGPGGMGKGGGIGTSKKWDIMGQMGHFGHWLT